MVSVSVYAESSFVLELVLAQEQQSACKELVRLAERHDVETILSSRESRAVRSESRSRAGGHEEIIGRT
jgi:hypothetical protein